MLLLFDIAEAAIDEHDDWHTHEHMPERIAIPGFRRATRWQREGAAHAARPGPRYCVLYEVDALAVLDGADYRTRLENPTPWTARMMTHYIGMRRTLCRVVAQAGEAVGGACLVVAFGAREGQAAALRARLCEGVLPGLHERRGVAAWRLLENALPAPMTREQSIRGRDAAVSSALWVTGYDAQVLAALAEPERGDLGAVRLAACGAEAIEPMTFSLANAMVSSTGSAGESARAPA